MYELSKQICENCKKAIVEHTENEIINCKLEIARNTEPEITDEDAIQYFNEIKSGEYSRISQDQKISDKN